MKLSIITTAYKAEQDLPRLLDSMMAQKAPELEFFLIDNGSPDRCGEICREKPLGIASVLLIFRYWQLRIHPVCHHHFWHLAQIWRRRLHDGGPGGTSGSASF